MSVAHQHRDGINRTCLSRREGIGGATVERWYHDCLGRNLSEFKNALCPKVLGIDEHFFTKKDGFATTFCDLGNHRVYDVVLGRSEASLEGYLNRLPGKDKVEVVCMDLSTTYRSLVNHHFLSCWKHIDPVGAKSRGLVSLMRRHREHLKSPEQAAKLDAYLAGFPGLKAIYEFKQRLCRLLLVRHQTKRKCQPLARQLLKDIDELKASKLTPLVTLGDTLAEWAEEIATMWRFTKNNGITEGFHNKMENLKRQAYGFRNFENYRLRVRVLCS